MRKVFIASDHAGFALKQVVVGYLQELGHEVTDIGPAALEPGDDYPVLIYPCAEAVAQSEGIALGIIIGSSGQGEAMVANRVPTIRAAVFYGESHASGGVDAEGTPGTDGYDIVRLARMHNSANILSLGARFITEEQAKRAVEIFLTTAFSTNERHQRRVTELG
jgi:ribose 5-phosphate isomerase B